jgi:hypothetical protein
VKVILVFGDSLPSDVRTVPQTCVYVCILFPYIHLHIWGS